jgi:putative transposase
LKLEFSRNLNGRTEHEEEPVHRGAIIGILKQHEAGVKTADVCREHGISAATFYGWKSKYGGMEVSEAQRLKAMEDENRRLKLLVAELSLHGEALKAVIRKNGWSLPV